jgi:tight adherence protein C
LKDEFARLLRDVRAGKPRAEALRELAARMDMPAVSSFVATLIQAEATGMSLGPILRAQADQRRTERFARAEKLAMEAPVKLLFPLIFFIFPCVFAILMFPIVMKFMASGF